MNPYKTELITKQKQLEEEQEIVQHLIDYIIMGENTYNGIEKLINAGLTEKDLILHGFDKSDIHETLFGMETERD